MLFISVTWHTTKDSFVYHFLRFTFFLKGDRGLVVRSHSAFKGRYFPIPLYIQIEYGKGIFITEPSLSSHVTKKGYSSSYISRNHRGWGHLGKTQIVKINYWKQCILKRSMLDLNTGFWVFLAALNIWNT